MFLELIKDSNRGQYEKCAKEYGTIFNTLKWINIFDEKIHTYGIYNKGNELMGGL